MIMQVVADEGVTAIFGYSGGAILPTYDAVFLYNAEQQKKGERMACGTGLDDGVAHGSAVLAPEKGARDGLRLAA